MAYFGDLEPDEQAAARFEAVRSEFAQARQTALEIVGSMGPIRVGEVLMEMGRRGLNALTSTLTINTLDAKDVSRSETDELTIRAAN